MYGCHACQWLCGISFWRIKFLTFFFTIYGHGSHLVHVPLIIWIHFRPPWPIEAPQEIMSPQPNGGGGGRGGVRHIAFDAEPVRVGVARCLYSISWTNGWILTKLADTLLGGRKEVIRLWPWPHFQGHTSTLKFSNFDQKQLVYTLSLKPNDGFWPNFIYCNVGMV